MYNAKIYFLASILLMFQLFSLSTLSDDNTIFPLQFTATVSITSHLIDNDDPSQYPPKVRSMTIYYDYLMKKARADIDAGYEAAKVYIRRYDDDIKAEFMIRLAPINDCKRSYLGEMMPYPAIPDLLYIGLQTIDQIECRYYLHEDYETRIHIYMSNNDGAPVKLIQESFDDHGSSIPMLTYDYHDVILGSPDASWFEVPEPYEPASCVRHAVGFPYLHIFHYFVKF